MKRFVREILISVIVFALSPLAALSQEKPPVQTFSFTAETVALPGGGKTVAGTVAGVTLRATANFSLRQDNILANGSDFHGYFGGFNYDLPVLGKKLDNASPNLNGARFHFYLTASAGAGQVARKQHYAFLAGGGVYYDLTNSGTWTFGGEARYAKLPGLANNTAIVTAGPALHF